MDELYEIFHDRSDIIYSVARNKNTKVAALLKWEETIFLLKQPPAPLRNVSCSWK